MTELLFDGASLRVIGSVVERSKLFVTFDHWRRERSSFPDYTPSKTALEHGYGHIYVQTAANDWFLNQDTTRMHAFLTELCQGKESCSSDFRWAGMAHSCLQRAAPAPGFVVVPAIFDYAG